jgi:hypothetical protein
MCHQNYSWGNDNCAATADDDDDAADNDDDNNNNNNIIYESNPKVTIAKSKKT